MWEIKAEFLGPTSDCANEVRVLNRILRWTDGGLEYEPDQRHADIIIEQAGVKHCNPVSTPCCADSEYDETKRLESGFLHGAEATLYRGIAARLNYLALDRPGVQYRAQ